MPLHKDILTLAPEQLGEIAAGLQIFADGVSDVIDFAHNFEQELEDNPGKYKPGDAQGDFSNRVSIELSPAYDEALLTMEEALPEELDIYDVSSEISDAQDKQLDASYSNADDVERAYSQVVSVIERTIEQLETLVRERAKRSIRRSMLRI